MRNARQSIFLYAIAELEIDSVPDFRYLINLFAFRTYHGGFSACDFLPFGFQPV